MQSFVVILAAAAIAAVANGAACDLVKLAPLLADANAKQCTTDSGFQLPVPPTTENMPKVCKSDACTASIKALNGLGLGDCTISTMSLVEDLIAPIEKECGHSYSAPTPVPTPTPTSAAFASSQASSILLGSSLVVVVYMTAS